MESAMRGIGAVGLAAMVGMLACAPAQADWLNRVPAFKGNDTGGIIAYSLASQMDIRARAIDHCAYYGKVVKFLAVDPQEGGYIAFACRWLPYGQQAPLRSYY
jgi:hypothetical protein